MPAPNWVRLGPVAQFHAQPLQQVEVAGTSIALSFADGQFGAISGTCLHAGGPLGNGTIQNGYVVCPWHNWMFHRLTGEARPGIPAAVPRFELKEEAGELWINLTPQTQAKHAPHPPHPLSREIRREPGGVRVAGISTTAMDPQFPRFSTSDFLLAKALAHAKQAHQAETQPHQAQRSQVPPLRRLLQQKLARLPLALLDHASRSRPTSWSKSMRRSSSGPTWCSSQRPSAGAMPARSITK